jgi:hypothetical protein
LSQSEATGMTEAERERAINAGLAMLARVLAAMTKKQ